MTTEATERTEVGWLVVTIGAQGPCFPVLAGEYREVLRIVIENSIRPDYAIMTDQTGCRIPVGCMFRVKVSLVTGNTVVGIRWMEQWRKIG